VTPLAPAKAPPTAELPPAVKMSLPAPRKTSYVPTDAEDAVQVVENHDVADHAGRVADRDRLDVRLRARRDRGDVRRHRRVDDLNAVDHER
jgi:hypothetical protein